MIKRIGFLFFFLILPYVCSAERVSGGLGGRECVEPRQTTVIAITVNLQADAEVLPGFSPDDPSGTSNYSSSVTLYDGIGQSHVATVYFVKTATAGEWNWHVVAPDSSTPPNPASGTINFTATGLLQAGSGAPTSIALTLQGNVQNVRLAFDGSMGGDSSTQYPMPFATLYLNQDGYPPAEKCVLVISPNGGEVWEALTTHTVVWDASSDAVKFRIFFSLDNGASWQQIGTGFITEKSLEWTIPFVVGQMNQCLVMVMGYDSADQIMGGDTSDGLFTIQGGSEIPTMVVSPNGSETWVSGSTQTIEWAAPPEAEKFRVFFSLDNGATWQQIGTGFVTGSSIEWNVPFVAGQKDQCLVMVIGYDSSERIVGGDSSDGLFTIDGLEPIYPNGGETFIATHVYTITWTTSPGANQVRKVKLYYSLNGGITWRKINAITGNPGTYDWKVPSMRKLKTNCKIKVVLVDDKRKTLGRFMSQNPFTIEP